MISFYHFQDPAIVPTAWESWLAGCFTMSPAVYAGTGILALCTMATVITYITCHRYCLCVSLCVGCESLCVGCVSLCWMCITVC